jgi:hypothetical protein
MKLILEPVKQELLRAEKRCALLTAALTQRQALATDFPHPRTKVTPISVDTAGREVPSPGQKGF